MKRFLAVLFSATVCLAALPALAVAADPSPSASTCTLSVSPASGPPGTEFVFSGSGYTPTRLTLRQPGKDPRVTELSLNGADPFTISLVATDKDSGHWTAVASIPGTDCAGAAAITVTLPPTATAGASTDSQTGNQRLAVLFGMSCLITLFLFATRFFHGRFTQRT